MDKSQEMDDKLRSRSYLLACNILPCYTHSLFRRITDNCPFHNILLCMSYPCPLASLLIYKRRWPDPTSRGLKAFSRIFWTQFLGFRVFSHRLIFLSKKQGPRSSLTPVRRRLMKSYSVSPSKGNVVCFSFSFIALRIISLSVSVRMT